MAFPGRHPRSSGHTSRVSAFKKGNDYLRVSRDLNTRSPSQAPAGKDAPGSDHVARPIEIAIEAIETGAAVASFPILGENLEGSLIIDITKTFSNDIRPSLR